MIQDTYGAVYAGGSVVTMARLESIDGTPIDPASVSSVSYTIDEIDSCSTDVETPITGHENQTLSPMSVLFSTLQTDAAWHVDAEGYNFRYEIDTTTNPAFPNAGKTYRLRYEVTPLSGQPVLFRYQIEAR